MAPITRKRRPDWEHRDPAQRAAAVAEARDPALRARLPEIARTDPDAGVRRAAIARLDDLHAVWAARADDDASVRESARARALALLERAPAPDPALMDECLAAAGADERLTLMRGAASAALRRRLVGQCDDPALLAERVLKDDDRAVQREALARLDDPDALERVVRATKRGERKLHREAAERMQRIRLQAGDPEAVRAYAATLVETLEGMVRAGEPDPERRLDIERQWQALPEAGRESLAPRFEGARRILERAAGAKPPDSAEPEPEAAPETETRKPEEPPAPALEALTGLTHEAELLAQQETPSDRAAETLHARWREAWREEWAEVAEAADLRQRFDEALDRANRRRDKARQARKDRHQRVAGLIESLEKLLEAGDLHETRTVDHEIKRLLSADKRRPSGGQQRRLAAAHRRLHELRDWQHWANNRVRQRLCEEVEALPESDLHPDAVLEALKRAQHEWRALEESEKLSGEKRAYRASGPGLWRRFQAAGKRAFEHAKPFLEKRSELRQQHLAQAQQLIERLRELEQAESVEDARALARALAQARNTLQRLDELPPPERGATARALRHALDVLGGRLDEHRAALAQRKEALIREASELVSDQDLGRAVNTAKRLMANWKRLETLPPGRERRLWSAFRKHLDPVFERRDAEHASEREAHQRERESLQSLCEAVERLAELPGPELAAATTELNRLRGQWQSARGRPKALEKRFRDAVDGFRHRLAAQRATEHFDRIRSVFAKARLCRLAEAGLMTPDEARKAWRELPELPPELEAPLAARLERATVAPSGDAGEANLERAERCVLAMELVSGAESPPEAERARMELKVMRLNQAMRGERNKEEPESEMDRLLLEWAAAGHLPAEPAERLEARAAAAVQAFYGHSVTEDAPR